MITKFLLPFCLCSLLLFSCAHDFIEDDLTGKKVTIIAPADSDTVTVSLPLFWWYEISGARSYRLQIAWPDFNAPQQLLFDTAVEGDQWLAPLQAGITYAWRIRPENGSSEGDWVIRTITIDSSISLANQNVIITSPAANGTATNSSSVAFTWNNLSSATFYRIAVVNNTTGLSVASTTTTLNGYTAILAQGNYTFSVRAENSSSFTAWAQRTITVDQTAPTVPVLLAPANNTFYASVPSTISFDWSNSTDAITDSLEIATDSLFASGIILQLQLSATQSAYTWTGAQPTTTYFWRVCSTDAAGNRSSHSSISKFIVN